MPNFRQLVLKIPPMQTPSYFSEVTHWGSDSPDEKAQASLSSQSLSEGKEKG